jgi:very-short-patch-repair endonuclease
MRSHPIDIERDLWWRLRSRKLGGLKFRRQQPMQGYVADFVCLEARLIIEIDGRQHRDDHSALIRSEKVIERGFKIIRFDNDQVRIDIDGVCGAILAAVMSRLSTPQPPSGRAGGHLLSQGEKVGGSAG